MSFLNSTLSHVKMLKGEKLAEENEPVEAEDDEIALAEKKADNMRHKMRKLSTLLFYLLGVGLSYQVALLVWNLVPSPKVELPGLTAEELAQIQTPVKEKKLSGMNIFGIPGEVSNDNLASTKGANTGMVRSRLNVNITGISASTDGRGAVTLVYNGKEETYGVGDKIGSAVIKKIKPNVVEVDNAGQKEEIVFLEDEKPARDNSRNSMTPDEKPAKPQISPEDVQMVRTELLSNPGNLLKYISIKPAMQDGKIIGYELNPGSDNRLFINSGLKDGDIAVEINGRDLTDNAQAMQVMGELQNMTEVSLVIDRNGSRETINLDLK